MLHSPDNAIKADTVSYNNGTTKSCILMEESLLPQSSQPSTCCLVHIHTPKIQGLGEHQLSVRFHLCAKQVPSSGRNWTHTLSRKGQCSCIENETGDDRLTLGLVLASGELQSEGDHKNHTFQHCFLSFILLFCYFLSPSLVYVNTACSQGCFMYCIPSQVLIQNTCRTESIMLSLIYSALSHFPF